MLLFWVFVVVAVIACVVGVVLCLCSWCLINLIDEMIVGVGLGDHVMARLLAYGGVDCGLLSHAHRVRMVSELCGEEAKTIRCAIEVVRKRLGDWHATTNHNQ